MRITPPKEDGPLLYPAEPGPSGEQIPGPAPILESAPVILDPQTQPAQCALFIQLQVEDCARPRSFGQQEQGLSHDVALPLHISDPANGTA